jgi:hypothetical protein
VFNRIAAMPRLAVLFAVTICLTAISLVAANRAVATEHAYNCGYVAAGNYCNPPISYWGYVEAVSWSSNTVPCYCTDLPVRVNRGSLGSTTGRWTWQGAWEHFYIDGIPQVRNLTGATQQLTVRWHSG